MKYNFIDIGMTEEYNKETGQWEPGDLLLTAPDLNYSYKPIEGTIDLAIKRNYENLKQILIFRCMTRKGDYLLNKGLGHSFDLLFGRRLSKELIEEGKQLIRNVIIYDNLIASSDLEIVGIPVDRNTILYTIIISNGSLNPYRFNLIFNMEEDTWRIE